MIRFCDVFFSLLGLIVLSPIFVIIALCIVLDILKIRSVILVRCTA